MKNIPALLGLLCLLGIPGNSWAEGAKAFLPQAIFQDEGDSVVPFSVLCSSTAWTVVVSSDIISRSVLYQAPADNSLTVCISTISTSGYACGASTPGQELSPGSTFDDYTKVGWYCRARATSDTSLSAAIYIKGRRSRDKGDYGYNR